MFVSRGPKWLLMGLALRMFLLLFALAIQNTWDLNARTRKAGIAKALHWCKCNEKILIVNGRAGSRYLRLQHYTFFIITWNFDET